VTAYTVYVRPAAWQEMKNLPGNVRQRVKRAVQTLMEDPRPAHSKALDVPPEFKSEVRKLRLERWRIVYLVSDTEQAVDILAVRRRPPYDYGDLAQLLEEAR
jgi:mRNA interferase RelE/StbE